MATVLKLVEIGRIPDGHGIESWSPFCLKIHRALRYAGLPYERHHARLPREGKAFNPTGQFPSLVIDGRNLPDSTPILQEIDRLSGGKLTAGLTGAALGEAWLWEEFGDSTLNSFMLAARWADAENWLRAREHILAGVPKLVRVLFGGRFRGGVVKRLVARDVWRAGPEACWRRWGETLDHLDARAPERGFWMGPAVSVADLSMFAQLRSVQTVISPKQAGDIAGRKRLHAWLARVDEATGGGNVV